MLTEPTNLFKLCEEIEHTPHDELRDVNRETLITLQSALQEVKRRVDVTLVKLAFLDAGSLH